MSVALGLLVAFGASPTPTERALQPVRDGIWRYTAGAYHGVLLVTDDGIVVTDPLSAEAATWLKAEIGRRFDQPLRYVLYSHNHPDHALGGEALDGPGVVFVAHELAARDWARTRAPVRSPDQTFRDSLELTVGGQRIQLRHHGRNNGLGSVSMYFVDQRVLHVVDWVVVGRLPYQDLRGYDINGMLDSTREVLDLPFETFVGGHADIGDRAGVERYLGYLESLHSQVLDGILKRHALERIQKDVDLSAYADLKQYDAWRGLNVQGVHAQLLDISYLDMRPDVPSSPR